MKAAIIEDVNKIKLQEIAIPKVQTRKAIVKIAFAGLCGPTDDAILRGLHPRARFPLILSHEFSGEITDLDIITKEFKKGDRVVVNPLIWCNSCGVCREGNQYICENLKLIGIDYDGGFAEYCIVPIENLIKLPDRLPLNIAALVEPMAVGVHSVRESGLQLGDTALIYGAGPIGLFVGEACRISGAGNITIVDINERRLELADSLGFSAINNAKDISKEKWKTDRFDFVFETTGSEKVLRDVLKKVRIKGILAIVGKFDYDIPLDLHTVLFNEITIKGIRVYRDSEFLAAVGILARDPTRYERIISDYFTLDEVDKVFETFKSRKNLSKIMVSFK